ncbi:toxin [Streptomyces xanthochromogenes]
MRISPKYDLSKATWHKSSYSGASGGDCLEVGRWRKSTYSGGDGCNCLEVADDVPHIVPVRDSKTAPHGPTLVFRAGAWSAFIADVKESNAAA